MANDGWDVVDEAPVSAQQSAPQDDGWSVVGETAPNSGTAPADLAQHLQAASAVAGRPVSAWEIGQDEPGQTSGEILPIGRDASGNLVPAVPGFLRGAASIGTRILGMQPWRNFDEMLAPNEQQALGLGAGISPGLPSMGRLPFLGEASSAEPPAGGGGGGYPRIEPPAPTGGGGGMGAPAPAGPRTFDGATDGWRVTLGFPQTLDEALTFGKNQLLNAIRTKAPPQVTDALFDAMEQARAAFGVPGHGPNPNIVINNPAAPSGAGAAPVRPQVTPTAAPQAEAAPNGAPTATAERPPTAPPAPPTEPPAAAAPDEPFQQTGQPGSSPYVPNLFIPQARPGTGSTTTITVNGKSQTLTQGTHAPQDQQGAPPTVAPVTAPIPPQPPAPRPIAQIQQDDNLTAAAATQVRRQEEQDWINWHSIYAPGVNPALTPAGEPRADASVKAGQVAQVLNSPVTADEILHGANHAQTAQQVRDVQPYMAEGYSIQHEPGAGWALYGPDGQSIPGTRIIAPTADNIMDMVAHAASLRNGGPPAPGAAPQPAPAPQGQGTQQNPIRVQQPNDVHTAAVLAQEPTPAQAAAGNQRKGHIVIGGVPMTIENAAGSVRTDKHHNPPHWSVTMPADYGYAKRSQGADGDQVDVYLGPQAHNAPNLPVFVVDQRDAVTGAFDEHKVMIGYPSLASARTVFYAAHSDGLGGARLGAISQIPWTEFKRRLAAGQFKKALAYRTPADLVRAAMQEIGVAPDDKLVETGVAEMRRSGIGPHEAVMFAVRVRARQMDAELTAALNKLVAEARANAAKVEAELAAVASPGSEWAQDATQPTSDWRAKNPDIPAVGFNGSGRPANAPGPYNGVDVPILGRGTYLAFSREAAQAFGPNVTERPLNLSYPLIIRSDSEWRALTKKVGWEHPNPFGVSEAEAKRLTNALRDHAIDQGHDGVIVQWDDSIDGDIDPRTGLGIKLLRDVFDQPQAVDYRKQPKENAGERQPEPGSSVGEQPSGPSAEPAGPHAPAAPVSAGGRGQPGGGVPVPGPHAEQPVRSGARPSRPAGGAVLPEAGEPQHGTGAGASSATAEAERPERGDVGSGAEGAGRGSAASEAGLEAENAPETPAPPSGWAERLAEDVNGEVPWQEGNIALIRGYAILNGRAIYAGAKWDGEKALRTTSDISAYQGSLFTAAELPQLLGAKARLVAADEAAFEAHPKGPFDQGRIAASESVDPKLVQYARQLTQMVGLGGVRVFLADPDDMRKAGATERYRLHGPYSAIGSAAHQTTGGSVRRLPNGAYYIAVSRNPRKSGEIEAIAHEIGHILQRETFEKANAGERSEINGAFGRWLKAHSPENVETYVRSLRAHTSGKTLGAPGNIKDSSTLPDYWRSFAEWFADQVARWATTDEKALSLLDKLFDRIAVGYRKLAATTGPKYKADETIARWLSAIPMSEGETKPAPAETPPQAPSAPTDTGGSDTRLPPPQATPEGGDDTITADAPEEPAGAPEPAQDQSETRTAAPVIQIAQHVAALLGNPEEKVGLTARNLQAFADTVFGGSLASGAYSRDMLYDAIELGANLHIAQNRSRWSVNTGEGAAGATVARAYVAAMRGIKDRLPTQTVRSGEKETHQQFSTPPDYAFVAAWVANVRRSDVVLEPSAGTGSLAVQAASALPKAVIVNEISAKRREMLGALAFDGVFAENAEQLDNALPQDVVPTVVIMNPPFSQTAGRMGDKKVQGTDVVHIEQALRRLAPGGRLVAIVGKGFKMAPDRAPWLAKNHAQFRVRANIGVSGKEYAKYGTSFDTRIVVIDRTPANGAPIIAGDVNSVSDLIDMLRDIHDDKQQSHGSAGQQPSSQPDSAPVVKGGAGGRRPGSRVSAATGDVGTGAGDEGQPAVGTEPARPGSAGKPGADAAASGSGARDESNDVGAGRPGGSGGVAVRDDDGIEPAGGSGSSTGGGARSDGGEHVETPIETAVVEQAVTDPHDTALTESVYEPYKPQRVSIKGARAHPGALVQSAAMASIMPPVTDYRPAIPAAVIEKGLLSDAQLEAVIYAGAAHAEMIEASGPKDPERRRGFFIGDGCVAAGTRIYNPISGEHTPIEALVERGEPHFVLALTETGFRVALATMTFLKGRAALYRVDLDDGSTITVTGQHRFLTPSGWVKLDDGLLIGDFLAAAIDARPSVRATHGAYAQHGSQTTSGLLDRCSPDHHPCDERSLPAEDSARAAAPSPADVLAHNRRGFCTDGRKPGPSHNDRCPSERRPARRNSSPVATHDRALISRRAVEALVPRSASTHQVGQQSLQATGRPHSHGAEVRLDRKERACGSSRPLICEECHACGDGTRSLAGSRHSEAQASSSASLTHIQRPSDPVRPVGSTHGACAWRRIVSIEFVRVDDFYDMYVPGPENYVAEGFVNHNTGVGKGRQVAGIILDNWMAGRKKALWVSEKRPLLNDARRDWSGLGQDPDDIFDLGKGKAGAPIDRSTGILFATYDTLKSAEQVQKDGQKAKGKTRVDQIVGWLGKDFDGVIAFDESHNLGNAVDTMGKRGKVGASQKALAGMDLQRALPNARVVYVSATGATEVANLSYADRLGLWGKGTAFGSREDFMGKIAGGGIAGMELVARDMKALGSYIARNLSYDGVEYDRVEHTLTANQLDVYDRLAEAWQLVLKHFNLALEETNADKNARAKSATKAQFWGAHQRFFNQIITAMQMPTVINSIEKDIAEGRQAVIQLVNTMEAAQERAIDKARENDAEADLEDLDMTPRDQLMQMVERCYPVQQYEEYTDENGNVRSRPVMDANGNPVLNAEMVRAREKLLNELGSLRVPDGPLEMILNHFGIDKVAEVTGRKQRVVKKINEKGELRTVVEPRGSQANVAEANAFQTAKKPILIFSDAGGTGRSYHAENGTPSANKRRSHYLAQPGWRADKAVQGLGRTHRTNQASAPIFHLVTTDLKGQKRFISSIARRLAQLGALTKGERRTGDQGMFGMKDNLESDEARIALKQFIEDLVRGDIPGMHASEFQEATGMQIVSDNGQPKVPEMSQFLNRLLSLTFSQQNDVFDAFSERLDDTVERAAAAGTLDVGVETFKADGIDKVADQVVYTEPRTGAETRHVQLSVKTRNHPLDFETVISRRDPKFFVVSGRSGKIFAVTPATSSTDRAGNIVPQYRLTGLTDYHFIDQERIDRDKKGNWRRVSKREDAEPIWTKEMNETPEFRTSDLHVITGTTLPIWDRLPGNPKIFRLQTDAGERMLGRVIPATLVAPTLKALGAGQAKIDLTPQEVTDRILDGSRATLVNNWVLRRSLVAGERRIELVGPDYRYAGELESDGLFSERIQWQTRWFVPTGAKAAAVVGALIGRKPIVTLEAPAQEPTQELRPAPKAYAPPTWDDIEQDNPDAPWFHQMALPPQPPPVPSPETTTRERVDELVRRLPVLGSHLATVAAKGMDLTDALQMMVAPMASVTATADTRAIAKQFANTRRYLRWTAQQALDGLTKQHKPERLVAMWDAADAESVAAQAHRNSLDVPEPVPGGFASLSADELRDVQAAMAASRHAFDRAVAAGKISSDAIPFYVPRIVVEIGTPDVHVVRDIRTLVLATLDMEEAVAGHLLIKRIEAAGRQAGSQTVAYGGKPANIDPLTGVHSSSARFLHRKHMTVEETEEAAAQIKRTDDGFSWKTIEQNRAFMRWAVKGSNKDGNPIWVKEPIFVRSDFIGPLRAVLRRPQNVVIRAYMDLKGRMMTAIMYGLSHLAVICGRAMPVTLNPIPVRFMREGGIAMRNPEIMERAVQMGGMDPIGRGFAAHGEMGDGGSLDVRPGQSWTAQILGALVRPLGKGASDATKHGVEAAGDYLHNTLLWQRIGALQTGIFLHFERKALADKLTPREAALFGGHMANRFAGALPQESMSQFAANVANLLLFSRTYRLGNLGALKDLIIGPPRDVVALVAPGRRVKFTRYVRRAMAMALALDFAFYNIGQDALQSFFDVATVGKSVSEEAVGYVRRLEAEGSFLATHPWELLNPIHLAITLPRNLSPQSEHEPGRENRILVGFEPDGTAIYIRPMLGKFVEDISDYLTAPLRTINSMMSPFMHMAEGIVENRRPGTDRPVYDPYIDTTPKEMRAIGDIAAYMAESSGPTTAIKDAGRILGDAFKGKMPKAFDVAQVVGGGLGVSFSHGYPGGPLEGFKHQARQEKRYEIQRVMPDIRDLIRNGGDAGRLQAVQQMRALGMGGSAIRDLIRFTLHPSSGAAGLAKIKLGLPIEQQEMLDAALADFVRTQQRQNEAHQ